MLENIWTIVQLVRLHCCIVLWLKLDGFYQFVVLDGDLSEPLVVLQSCDDGHQVPSETAEEELTAEKSELLSSHSHTCSPGE